MAMISRPEIIMSGAAVVVILMMLAAIMVRMSRRDNERDRHLSELQAKIDERLDNVTAQTEVRLNESVQQLNNAVERLGEGMTRTMADAEHTQAGRMYDYTSRADQAFEKESERSRAFSSEVSRRIDELDEKTERRMQQLRIDITSDVVSELDAKIDRALSGLDKRFEQLGAASQKTVNELDGIREALNRHPDGDARLDTLLAQWLSPGRYVRHFEVGTGSGKFADFAITLPDENGQMLYLPVDSSFPASDYSDKRSDEANLRLQKDVSDYARGMAAKLIKPGLTTDFAIMLIQNEVVCARVCEIGYDDAALARRVIPTGSATFWAMVRTLEASVNALAMQKRSDEIERLLSDVRSELKRFAAMPDTVKLADNADAQIELSRLKQNRIEDKHNVEAAETADSVKPQPSAGQISGDESEVDIWN